MGSGLYAVCRLAVVPVRLLPGHRSETTSQVRCGESVEVLETRGAFARVRILSDSYEGWVDSRQFTAPGPDVPAAATHVTDDICGQAMLDSRRLLLPLGTPLPDWKDGAFSLGAERWQWTGKVRALPQGPPRHRGPTAAAAEAAPIRPAHHPRHDDEGEVTWPSAPSVTSR